MEPLTQKQKHELKKFYKQLSSYSGNHTELVTVYVPVGYDMTKVINHLQQEQGTATNIKSTSTRKNVIDALEKMIQHLKLIAKTPENGLMAFGGNISDRDGQSDVKVFSIEPPMPLNQRIYRCDKNFILDPIKEMIETDNVYGLVVLDKRDGTLALLKGTKIQVLMKTHSEVPGKTRAGGQSAPRFQRIREGAARDHYKKIANYMTENFLGVPNLKGIIIGGPNITVTHFMNQDYVTGDLKKKILGTKDLSYTEEFGLQELLDKSEDILAKEAVMDEKLHMGRFFVLLATTDTKVAYGMAEIERGLDMNAIDILMLSESLDDDVLEKLAVKADEGNTKVVYVSTDTREGMQLRDIGKVAAILRYAIH
ncbi:MAG: peptide chain release factor subunit 1 [Candidatus Woesearchaeota archaeon]|jgi:peptide chain release factor subunit 1